jgi:hypothetical protein
VLARPDEDAAEGRSLQEDLPRDVGRPSGREVTDAFEQAKEAYEYMAKATLVGKVVIRVD